MIVLLLILVGSLSATPLLCGRALSAERWPADGLSTPDYDFDFAVFLKSQGRRSAGFFKQTITESLLAHGSMNVLDLFGSGLFFTDATAVTGFRRAPLEATETERGILPPQVHGSALEATGWAELDRSSCERKLGGFDMVVMRPLGGWNDWGPFKDELAAFTFVVEHVLARLAPGGAFYFALWSRLDGARVRASLARAHPDFDERYAFACTDGTFPWAGVIRDRRSRPRAEPAGARELSFADELARLRR